MTRMPGGAPRSGRGQRSKSDGESGRCQNVKAFPSGEET